MFIKKKLILILIITTAIIASLGVVCGGVYYLNNRITYTINDTLPNGQGKSAKVIILAGQSNASGCSSDEYLQRNVSANKYEQYQKGFDNVYINYISGKNASQAFVKCSTKQGELKDSFGPELGMAEKLNQLYPNELFFIIKCAWGDTNLHTQWLSPSSTGKTGQKYREFEAFVSANIKYLLSKNYNIKIEGMCWMQGESDSFLKETATMYEYRLNNFIKDIRKKFSKYASDNGIAFVDAYIAANPIYWVEYKLLNQSKFHVSNLSSMNTVIDTNAAGLACSQEPEDSPDIPHYDSLSQIKLGHLFAERVCQFFD